MKKHYAKYPRVTYSACGFYQFGKFTKGGWVPHSAHYIMKVTRCKKKVTCENCKRSKKFRGVK